ncbi:MAG: hypothetical protein HRT57_14265, partial [Crocinitomicaceae bacterium]|nr:hypothetical protein [Crocinitomicaceae bacterium]
MSQLLNPASKGYDFPYYSHTTLEEVENNVQTSWEQLKSAKELCAEEDFIEFESIYSLRNKESMELLGEDFETIRDRQNSFLNDFSKLRLLELLFPIRITENPRQFDPWSDVPIELVPEVEP